MCSPRTRPSRSARPDTSRRRDRGWTARRTVCDRWRRRLRPGEGWTPHRPAYGGPSVAFAGTIDGLPSVDQQWMPRRCCLRTVSPQMDASVRLRAAVGCAIGFVVLTVYVWLHPVVVGDHAVGQRLVADPGSIGWDIAVVVSFVASGLVVALCAVVAAAWTAWHLRRPAGAIAIMAAPAIAGMIEVVMKSVVGRAAPADRGAERRVRQRLPVRSRHRFRCAGRGRVRRVGTGAIRHDGGRAAQRRSARRQLDRAGGVVARGAWCALHVRHGGWSAARHLGRRALPMAVRCRLAALARIVAVPGRSASARPAVTRHPDTMITRERQSSTRTRSRGRRGRPNWVGTTRAAG